MCGFAGQITVDPSRPVSQDLIRAMTSRLAHRGPDGEGFWFGRGIGLGHRRLSIIDLNERAAQPMIAFHEGFVTTFKELRDELTREGFRFRTESDTEVLLHGYERWGIEGLLTHLGGMFAFALFDVREDLLFLCRDRFGKKPLYYHYDGRMLTFASESPALTLGLSPLPLDNRALDFYLTELSVPQPLTIWRGVHQVRPAHTVRFQRSANSLKETPYWTRCHVPKRAPSRRVA
jgi:asparagine synthase (glutamine-hydrolysing)